MTRLIHKYFQAWVVQHLQVDALVGWKKPFQKTEYFSTCHAPAHLMLQYTMLQLLD